MRWFLLLSYGLIAIQGCKTSPTKPPVSPSGSHTQPTDQADATTQRRKKESPTPHREEKKPGSTPPHSPHSEETHSQAPTVHPVAAKEKDPEPIIIPSSGPERIEPLSEEEAEKLRNEIPQERGQVPLSPPAAVPIPEPEGLKPLTPPAPEKSTPILPVPKVPEVLEIKPIPVPELPKHIIPAAPPLPLFCGKPRTLKRSCTQEERTYISRMQFALKKIEKMKNDLNFLTSSTCGLSSQPHQPANFPWDDKDIILLADIHADLDGLYKNASLVSLLLTSNSKNTKPSVYLQEGIESRIVLDAGPYQLLHIILGVENNSDIYSHEYHAYRAKIGKLLPETTHHFDNVVQKLFPNVIFAGWDVSATEIDRILKERSYKTYKELLPRNESLVSTVKHVRKKEKYGKILVSAGADGHIPSGELLSWENAKTYAQEIKKHDGVGSAVHAIYGMQLLDQRRLFYQLLSTQPIYDYLKDKSGVYITLKGFRGNTCTP
jgi:hypothetical protein